MNSWLCLIDAAADFDAATIPLSFTSSVTSTCVGVTIFNDFFIEQHETFSITIAITDPALDVSMDAQVTIGDSNTRDVLVSLDQSEYTGSEGGVVSVCIAVRSSNVTDITREVVARLFTTPNSAQGQDKSWHSLLLL